MSVSGRCSGISRADGRNASLEHIMVEFTASTCPSLRGKPRLFSFSISKGHLGSTMSAQSSQAESLQKRIPWGCSAFSPVRKTAAPKKPTFCVFVWLLHIQLINPTENQGLFLSSWRISHHFIIAGEGRGTGGFWGEETRCFQGRKDGSQSSLTEHYERLLKIDCKWGGVIRMLRGHRGIR